MKIKKGMNLKDFLDEFRNAGFQAKKLYQACKIINEMKKDKECVRFLCTAGALVPGGMKHVLVDMLESGVFDGFITTGASVTHDLIEAFGEKHLFLDSEFTDTQLQIKGLNRIYNIVLPNRGYVALEKNLLDILPKIEQREMSSCKFFHELGKHIRAKNSIVKICSEKNIPIFVPALTDSVLGFHVWMHSQDNKLSVNPLLDIKEILNMVFESNKRGALITGGGTPKHFIAMACQIADRPLNYAIQVTMDRPEAGTVSGAKLEEAKSWRKVAKDAKTVDLICDATIALPIIHAAMNEGL
jgi:deoxyhypusine synthase